MAVTGGEPWRNQLWQWLEETHSVTSYGTGWRGLWRNHYGTGWRRLRRNQLLVMAAAGGDPWRNQFWQWLEETRGVTSYGSGWRRLRRNQLWQWLEEQYGVTNYGSVTSYGGGWRRKDVVSRCWESEAMTAPVHGQQRLVMSPLTAARIHFPCFNQRAV